MPTKKKPVVAKPARTGKEVANDCADHILDTCTPDELAEALEVFTARMKQAVAEMERRSEYLGAAAKAASNYLA